MFPDLEHFSSLLSGVAASGPELLSLCHQSSLKHRPNDTLLCSKSNKSPPAPYPPPPLPSSLAQAASPLPSNPPWPAPSSSVVSKHTPQTLLGLRLVPIYQGLSAQKALPPLSTIRTPTHPSKPNPMSSPRAFFPVPPGSQSAVSHCSHYFFVHHSSRAFPCSISVCLLGWNEGP